MADTGAATGPGDRHAVLRAVRRSVRGVLEQTPAYAEAGIDQRRELANRMVTVAMMGADLVADEAVQTERAARPARAASAAPLATAQEFGDAARAAGKTFQDIRQAIDFPTYVQSLITGVFQAITTSNIQQLTAVGDMLDAVSRTQDEFTSENIRDGDVVAWAVQKFPFLQARDGGLAVRDGIDISEKTGEIATQLRASQSEVSGVDGDDLMGSLGPLIRRRIGSERQAMLASMVQMGLQRVVVDEGRLHASMDMRVDTRSALEQERAKRDELNIDTGASAQVGMGFWGASAHINVGYNKVESEHTASREEIDTRAGLRSSVDLAFRTDQIPLDKMASPAQRAKLDANARVPAASVAGEGSLLATDRMGSLPSTDPKIQRNDSDSQAAQRAREQQRDDRNRQQTEARTDQQRREDQQRQERQRTEDQQRQDRQRREDQERADRQRTQGANNQPANTQPANTQPAGTQPAGTQPAGTQPAGTQPAGTQPAAH